MMRLNTWKLGGLATALAMFGCGVAGQEEEVVKGPVVVAPIEMLEPEVEISPEDGGAYTIPIPDEVWEKAQEYYKKAIESGEQVPTDVKDWVQRDISSIGDWEYRILDTVEQDADTLAAELNALGEERWECFHVDSSPSGMRFYFKKSKRSYMKNVSGLVRFIPMPGSN